MAKMFRGCINLEILNISSFTGESLEESDNMYTQCLNIHTIIYNSKYPEFEKNTNDTTTKVTNYFELELNNYTYDIYLMADFDKDSYYIKISERPENDLRL